MKKNNWVWSDDAPMGPYLWEKLRTAHDWQRTPSELGICEPHEDLDYMTAYSNTQAKMAAWEQHIREEEKADRAAMKEASKGSKR